MRENTFILTTNALNEISKTNKMKLLLIVLFAVFACTQATFTGWNQLRNYRPIIQNGKAIIPLCFPNGFPYPTAPFGQCYKVGFPGSIDARYTPCLPPVVTNNLVPPCLGEFFTLNRY